MMPMDISDMLSIFQNAFTWRNQFSLLGRAICLDKALFTTLCRYYKVFCLYNLTCPIFIIFIPLLVQWSGKEAFLHRVSETFHRAEDSHQHKWYCKTEVEPGNLIDAVQDTGGYSKEVREARWDRIRRYLDKLDAEQLGATI